MQHPTFRQPAAPESGTRVNYRLFLNHTRKLKFELLERKLFSIFLKKKDKGRKTIIQLFYSYFGLHLIHNFSGLNQNNVEILFCFIIH